MPPKGVTALIITAANPEQTIVGVADPYLAELQRQLEPLIPSLVSLTKLEQLTRLIDVDVDELVDHLADAAQLATFEPIAQGPEIEDLDEAMFLLGQRQDAADAIARRLTAALKLLKYRGRPTIVGAEKLRAADSTVDSAVDSAADGAK